MKLSEHSIELLYVAAKAISDMKHPSIDQILDQYGYVYEAAALHKLYHAVHCADEDFLA